MKIILNKMLMSQPSRLRFFAVAIMAILAAGCSGDMQVSTDSGQCWSMKGGVGNLLKNSSTKEECKTLGGKSWCPVGGGCEDL